MFTVDHLCVISHRWMMVASVLLGAIAGAGTVAATTPLLLQLSSSQTEPSLSMPKLKDCDEKVLKALWFLGAKWFCTRVLLPSVPAISKDSKFWSWSLDGTGTLEYSQNKKTSKVRRKTRVRCL